MIKKQSELRVEEKFNLRGGAGVVRMIHVLEQADAANTGRLFGRLVIPVGGSVGYHDHQGEFELYYILQGKALVNDNGEEHVIETGDMMLCRDGESHSITNIGDVDLEFMAIIVFTEKQPAP